MMSLTDKMKLDHLWKKIEHNVAQTYFEGKNPNNESLSSRPALLEQDFWSMANDIPRPMPNTTTALIDIRKGETAVRCRMDPTAPFAKTWVAVNNYNQAITPTNRLSAWIPPSIDYTYGVKIWAGDPRYEGVLINLMNEFRECHFDYSAGVLHFYGEVPNIVRQNGIWIEGARYTGGRGTEGIIHTITTRYPNFGKPTEEVSLMQETEPLEPYRDNNEAASEKRFTLPTGSHFILKDLQVSAPCLIECHDNSRYDDSNPYAFVATAGHLVDDGSYVMGNQRYYGPKFVTLFNRQFPDSDFSYWKVRNLSETTQPIYITVTVLRFLKGLEGERQRLIPQEPPTDLRFTQLLDTPNYITPESILIANQGGSAFEYLPRPLERGKFLGWNGSTYEWSYVNGSIVALNTNGTVTLDFSQAKIFTCLLTEDTTILNPINLVPGSKGSIILRQNDDGGKSVTFDVYYKWPSGVVPTLTTTANAVDRIDYLVVSGSEIHCSIVKDIK
jgi:hypothetical protein